MTDDQTPNSKAWFDREYADGGWDFLGGIDELARYSVIVGYFAYHNPAGAVLDVGCGTGLLQQRLAPYPYRRYQGIDFSDTAIDTALARADSRTSFAVAEPGTYQPDTRFDFIVFNEYLYYDPAYLATVGTLSRHLTDDGLIIASMYATQENQIIWQMLDTICDVVDQTKIGNAKGMLWTVRLLRPKGRAAP